VIFKFGELFCGPGGLSYGAHQARVLKNKEIFKLEHTWAIDNDQNSCNTYTKMICPNKPETVINADIRNIYFARLKKVNAIAFGFPCNDFSIVGKQKGLNGNFGPLYTYGIKAINNFEPLWFIAENVGGIRSDNGGKTFLKILNELKEAGSGYDLTVHLYKFEKYGVPQTRHRFIIIGIRKDLNLDFNIPAPTTENNFKTARETLEDIPIPQDAMNNEKTKQSKQVIERLKHIKWDENAWTADLPDSLKLNVKKTKLSQIYKRLHPDKPSYTITGSGGGGTHVYHWNEPRALTNRERARLQTFPDDFIFTGSKESVRKQIGMAVPPLAAKLIIEAVLKTFAGVKYKHVKPNYKFADKFEHQRKLSLLTKD